MNCPVCGTKMKLSKGWVPTYNNPDNQDLEYSAEPFCPNCDNEKGIEMKMEDK